MITPGYQCFSGCCISYSFSGQMRTCTLNKSAAGMTGMELLSLNISKLQDHSLISSYFFLSLASFVLSVPDIKQTLSL